jgi:tetratricopeptide (TPR) repeat protein
LTLSKGEDYNEVVWASSRWTDWAKLGKSDEALATYRQAVRLAPNAALHYHLGNLYRGRGDLDDAERAYCEAVRLDGNHHGAAIDALADLLLSRGKLDGAIAAYQRALRLKPGNAATEASLSRAQRLRELLVRLPGVLAGKDTLKSAPDSVSSQGSALGPSRSATPLPPTSTSTPSSPTRNWRRT